MGQLLIWKANLPPQLDWNKFLRDEKVILYVVCENGLLMDMVKRMEMLSQDSQVPDWVEERNQE